ncbi:MAG: alpha-glucan family phosphorylase [Acidobacteria bacterium]|nr:alpha-glucan family phosphorylase [Acidobacteriota bacterium]
MVEISTSSAPSASPIDPDKMIPSASNGLLRVPSLQITEIHLPDEVSRLNNLAYNLWWTWNSPARRLFAAADRASWARYRNPVELLLNIDREHWETLIHDDEFMARYSEVTAAFDAYMAVDGETWFSRRILEQTVQGDETSVPSPAPDSAHPVAYFCAEYGIHQSLAIYSGGLGVLSGDHCKSASDLGLPFLAVGLLYRRGYFQQTIDADGFQQHTYTESDFNRLPLRGVLDLQGRELIVRVPFPGHEVAAKVWLAQVGRVPLLLLDTDLRRNDPSDRPITAVLYVRGREMRLAQEAVLGIGGVRALEALGLEPAVWHINEGHSALLQLERARHHIVKHGTTFDQALAAIRCNTTFTTHTPVAAGHETFDRPMAKTYCQVWAQALAVDTDTVLALGAADHGERDQPLNLTAVALRTSAWANGVSRLNGEIADRMWRHIFPSLPADRPAIHSITNGVHAPTWMGLEMAGLIGRIVGPDWVDAALEPDGWKALLQAPDRDVFLAHRAQKERLSRFARARLREQLGRHGQSPAELRALDKVLDPDILTVGFARRFATYKRAGLLFSDLHRLRMLLHHAEHPVQVILAGKAHPADRPGQELIQSIFHLSRSGDLRDRVVFLENYDMRVARMMVQGCDLWLNTPRRPLEASGTSGMKAAINGTLNLSISDGWWPEAYDGENGWVIGNPDQSSNEEWQQDQLDAQSLYRTLEEEIVPEFYRRGDDGLPTDWIARMKRSIVTIGQGFSSHRMVRDYIEKAYLPLSRGSDSQL